MEPWIPIQMKDNEKSFPVVLFITLYKVVLTLSLWTMKSLSVAIQMKAIDPYHSAAKLSLGGIKSFVFARQASARREFRARLAVQKQSSLFS